MQPVIKYQHSCFVKTKVKIYKFLFVFSKQGNAQRLTVFYYNIAYYSNRNVVLAKALKSLKHHSSSFTSVYSKIGTHLTVFNICRGRTKPIKKRSLDCKSLQYRPAITLSQR